MAEDLPAGIQKDHQCIRLFVVNVEKTVKYPLNRLGISPFSAVTVSATRETRDREDSAEEILEDLVPVIEGCTKWFVTSAERNAKFLSNPRVTNRFIAANVLAKEAEIKVPTRQASNLS